MIKKRLFPSILSIAVLAGCASTAPAPVSKPAPIANAMADADAAVKAGRNDQAYTILKAAAVAHPTDKSPWLRMAQLRFEDKNYGEAIVTGLQAIERDPDDMLAYSLVAASGLRVSSKALNDLTQKNGFTGSVRSEAQDLAALLHTKLGGPIVVSKRGEEKTRAASIKPATPVAPASKACSGPFCGLN
jgi:cytochrome c-type biogenesis protein CcmH/NrfG